MDTTARSQIERWRDEIERSPLYSAQRVQDHLLDLYPSLRGTALVDQVEHWLALTRERSLFEEAEINGLLDEIETALSVDEALGLVGPEPSQG